MGCFEWTCVSVDLGVVSEVVKAYYYIYQWQVAVLVDDARKQLREEGSEYLSGKLEGNCGKTRTLRVWINPTFLYTFDASDG